MFGFGGIYVVAWRMENPDGEWDFDAVGE